MSLPLIKLQNVGVALDGVPILHGIDWRLMPGEHWAILGANGSGKSTLLKLIRGELWPAPDSGGRRVYTLDGDEQTTAVGMKEKIALVSPELQQRYLQQEWRLNGSQVVHSGFGGGDYVYQKLTHAQEREAQSAAELLGVAHLAGRNVQELSTGELRRLLVARALAPAPRVLICDEICDGLDVDGRAALLQALNRVARSGTQLLYTTHRAEELLPALTHRLMLEKGRIAWQKAISPSDKPAHHRTAPGAGTPPGPPNPPSEHADGCGPAPRGGGESPAPG
jgi:molybdate transport system ATP-binding protein